MKRVIKLPDAEAIVKNNEFRSLVTMRIFKDDFHTRKILDRLEL